MDHILSVLRAKWKIILLPLLILAILILLMILFPQIWQKQPVAEILSPEQEKINQQLRELDALRQQSGDGVTTGDEIDQQLKDLDILHERTSPKPLTVEEVQKQNAELDVLRFQAEK